MLIKVNICSPGGGTLGGKSASKNDKNKTKDGISTVY